MVQLPSRFLVLIALALAPGLVWPASEPDASGGPPSVTVGATPAPAPIDVPPRLTVTLPAGEYGPVVLGSRSVLRLSGGVYRFASLSTGKRARIETLAPSQVRIDGRLGVGTRSFIGPADAAVALNLGLDVRGKDEPHSRRWAGFMAAVFRKGSEIHARVLVPNGTAVQARKSLLVGAIHAGALDTRAGARVKPYAIVEPRQCYLDQCNFVQIPGQEVRCWQAAVPATAGVSCDLTDTAAGGSGFCDGSGNCAGDTTCADLPALVSDASCLKAQLTAISSARRA